MSKKQINKFIPYFILSFGTLISLALVLYLNHQIDERIINDNKHDILELENKIQIAFQQYLHPLQGNASIYKILDFKISPQKYREVALQRDLFKEFKGALGFGFIRFVKENEVNKYLQQQKKYYPNFKLKRLIKENEPVFTKNFYIIEVVEPIEINQKAVGLVVSDEKNRFEAAINSMRTGKPTLTKPIRLVQDNTNVPGFLMYYPIYKTPVTPTTEEERIKQFVGWTYAPILSSAVIEFVKKLHPNLPPIKIAEEVNAETIFSNLELEKITPNITTSIFIFGNEWKVYYDQDYATDQNFHHVTLSFLFLLMLSIFSFIAYYLFKKQIELNQLENDEAISKQKILIATDTINNQRIFFKKLLDSIPSLVGYWDVNLNNIFCNATYTDFYGKTPEEIFGIHISELLPPHIYELNKPLLEATLNGETQIFRRTMLNISGDQFEVNVKYIPDFQDGNVVGIFVIVEDITAFVQKEEQVHMLLEVIEFAPVTIEITNKNNIIEYVNQFHVITTGYSKHESINFPPSKFSSGKTPKETYLDLRQKLKEHATWTGEFINRKKNGEEYIEEATISTILDENGEVSHYVAIKKDITEIRKSESQLMFNSKLASIGEMAAGVAHEINNPLVVIQMGIDSIEKKSERQTLTPENLSETIKKIRSHSERISRIVKSLKLYTRDSTNEDLYPTKISTIVESVLDLCLEKTKHKDIKFELGKFDDFEIDCNEIKIQQVLVNLINNATEAIEENLQRWIRFTIEKDLNYVYFKIFDSGSIDQAIIEKMFNPFFTTKPVGKGTGLGLSISLNIAKEHKGTLFLDKNYSNTCFVLKFPLKKGLEQTTDSKIAS